MDSIALSAAQLARALGTSTSTIYRHAAELGGVHVGRRLTFPVGAGGMVDQEQLRVLVRSEIVAEFERRSRDRTGEPLTGRQIALVHARRDNAGLSRDDVKAYIGERFGTDSLATMLDTNLDELLEWINRCAAIGAPA